jgi:hypothetical protein
MSRSKASTSSESTSVASLICTVTVVNASVASHK